MTNSGPSTGTAVSLVDTLPAGVRFLSSTPSQGTCSGTSTVSCDIGALASGDVATVSIVVVGASIGDHTNIAAVSSGVADPNSGDNVATETTTVIPSADLVLSKEDSPDPVFVGSALSYALTVANNGPSSATGVTITDSLPTDMRFVYASEGCQATGGTVICAVGTLGSGDVATVNIVVIPPTVSIITNTASVTANEGDPVEGDNIATEATAVDPAADLSITMADSPDPVLLGESFTYTLVVRNGGPSYDNQVRLTDTLPAGVSFVSVSPSQGTCTGTTTVACNLGTISWRDIATVSISVVADSTGDLANTAVVSSSVADPSGGDNTVTDITTVSPAAGLVLTQTASPNPLLLGTDLIYTLRVVNVGPSEATGGTLTDTLPAGGSFVSASAGCGEAGGSVTCAIGTLGSGDAATVNIVVSVASVNTIINIASVTSSVPDPTPADNFAAETTPVKPASDLSVTKADSSDPVLLGEEFTYTLSVINEGPSYDTGVRLTDALPAGVSFVSATPSQGTCSGTSTVACILGTIASGDAARVSIVAIADSIGLLTNTVTVVGTVPDLDTGDNVATETTTVSPASDLVVSKTDGEDPVLLDSNLTYSLSVVNKGPSEASGITLTDTLPAEVSFVSASAGCDEAGGTVTCAIGTLGSGDSSVVSIVVGTDSTGDVVNVASVRSNQGDPNTGDNTATETTSVHAPLPPPPVPSADLSVAKVDSPDPVLLGGVLTYTLRVVNKGPSTGTAVTLTDHLPEGMEFVSATPSEGTCSESTTITCTIGTLGIGGSATVSVVVTASAIGIHTNTAVATGDVPDPNTGDNTATTTTTVSPAADLVLSTTDSVDPSLLGDNLAYTLSVTNKGPSAAVGVTLTDTLPRRVTFVSSAPSQGTCSGAGTVTCVIGDMGSGDVATVNIVVSPTSASTVTNTATVGSGVADPNTFDNTTTETTTISRGADLSVTKADSTDPVLLGQEFTYTMTVINRGPSYDTLVTLTDTLPAGVRFVSSTPSQGTCAGSKSVTCTIGIIASGDVATVSIALVAIATGDLANTSRAVGNVADPNTGDNIATETTKVNPAADLVLSIADSPDLPLGSDLSYFLTINNKGPSKAVGITLSNTLPPEVEFVSASVAVSALSRTSPVDLGFGPAAQACRETSGIVNCVIGTLLSGDDSTLKIVVRPTVVSTITNIASVTSSVADPIVSDNTTTETTTARPAADLSVTKADSPDPVLLGQEFSYTFTVSNSGPSYDTLVSLADTLPAGVRFASASQSCTELGGSVTCTIGTLGSGDTSTASIIVTAVSTGDITNTATVIGSVSDRSVGNNTATETTRVEPAADLALTKTDSPDPVLLGEEFTYTLSVRNSGPSKATGVTVTDTLPVDVSFVSGPAGCGEAAGAVTCIMGTIVSGDVAAVGIVVVAGSTGDFTNIASVTGNEGDPNTGDNSTGETTTVEPAADLVLTKTDSDDPALLGEELTYTLRVSNKGPSEATGVTLTDTLPVATRFVSASARCTEAGGTVTCTIGAIASGDVASVSIVVTTTATGEHTNVAAVTGNEGDPNRGTIPRRRLPRWSPPRTWSSPSRTPPIRSCCFGTSPTPLA